MMIKALNCLLVFIVATHAFFNTEKVPSKRMMLLRMNGALESLTVHPISSISGELTLPGSKSLSNRVLLLAALSEGTTRVENLLDSADIRYMLGALKDLKVPVDVDFDEKTAIVVGRGGAIDSPGLANDEPVVRARIFMDFRGL